VRMADTDASEAGRALNARRWDPAVRLRSAALLVLERHAELPDSLRSAVHEATGEDTGGRDDV